MRAGFWKFTETFLSIPKLPFFEVFPLEGCIGFDRNDANIHKNWDRHQVTPEEAEDVFFNEPLITRSDLRHSKREKRRYALGQTASGRRLFVSFTIRRNLIRVVSVRDMNHKEQNIYGKHEKANL